MRTAVSSTALALVLVASTSLVSVRASAQSTPRAPRSEAAAPDQDRDEAERDWPRRTPVPGHAIPSAVLGGLTLGGGLALHFALGGAQPDQTADRWRGGVMMDEGFRDSVRLTNVDQQELARKISDLTMVATMMQAQFIDALLVPLVQGDPDLAWQASFAHTMALGLTLGIGEIVKTAVGRARPFERDCAADPQRPGCSDPDRFGSFYSLHTGMAFTSAGFSCAMHLSKGLYADPAADIASCGASVAMAATTGMLRIVSDRHYLTDVLVGAVIGFLVGYVVPLAIIPDRVRVAPDDAGDEQTTAARVGLPDDEAAVPQTPRASWHFEPMLSSPSSALARPIDGSAWDGTSSAGIGPTNNGEHGGMSGVGGTFGLSIAGTF